MLVLPAALTKFTNLAGCWRRGAGSNRRIKALQASALPLGYRAGLSHLKANVFGGARRS